MGIQPLKIQWVSIRKTIPVAWITHASFGLHALLTMQTLLPVFGAAAWLLLTSIRLAMASNRQPTSNRVSAIPCFMTISPKQCFP